MKFTEKTVASLPAPTDKTQIGYWDSERTGFGVIVGKTGTRTFVCRGIVAGSGERVKITIGKHRAVRPDGNLWTVEFAWQRAKELLGQLAGGINPNAKAKPADVPSGPTLREGVEVHLAKMRKKNRAARSIQTFVHETGKYLADWLDTPINEVDAVAIHEQVKARAAKRKGTNPLNAKGAPLANRVVAHISASWRSLNKQLRGRLGSWNPAASVDKDTIKPSRERIADEDLPDYVARVATMRSPIRRDGLHFALFTGLRHEDVRSIRWDHFNEDEHTLAMPDPKGGEARAFLIPLSKTPLAILKRRKADNERDLGAADGGWVFPGLDQDGNVGAISNLRQITNDSSTQRFPVEDVHSLRRTWESIANDEGVSELDQHVLSNHAFGSHNVNATYISQHIDHLATQAAKIDAGITRRMKPPTKKRKAKLHSVAA